VVVFVCARTGFNSVNTALFTEAASTPAELFVVIDVVMVIIDDPLSSDVLVVGVVSLEPSVAAPLSMIGTCCICPSVFILGTS